MFSRLIPFVALVLICPGTAFPLSALSGVGSPFSGLSATQLLSLHDGTYLALINSFLPITELDLNSRVRTVPFLSQGPVDSATQTAIVARVCPTNDSVIWAYAINDFQGPPASAVVDGALSIFVVGDAAFPDTTSTSGFFVLRFSVNGEAIWGELYNSETPGITFFPGLPFSFTGSPGGPSLIDLARPRTLTIASTSFSVNNDFGKVAFFVDTVTRKVRRVRFPLPDGPGTLEPAGVAADAVSGAACFADVEDVTAIVYRQRLFVQCANAADGSEVVSRVLVPFQDDTTYGSPRMIMANEGEGKAAALYVIALREISNERRDRVPRDPFTAADEAEYVNEMLLFKLNPTTLEDVEWDSGRTSKKPTMRKLLLTTRSRTSLDTVNSLEYIRDRNTLVVLFVSGTVFDGIETLSDGTIAFVGNSSITAEPPRTYQWLLYFGNDPEPAAVRIPDDPRPNGEQDNFDFLNTADLELSEDKRDLYLFGSLERVDGSRSGGLITFPLPLPNLTEPSAESLAMGEDLGDGVEESFEPSPDDTADANNNEEVKASPNPIQEQDM